MINHWDEFSKSLAQPVPRRESLRRLGFVVAGAVLSPLGLESAFAGHQDPCKAFCRCRKGKQQNQCLSACKACSNDPTRLAGSCGNYVCCGAGQTRCDNYCANLGGDVYNCGECGYVCDQPGPYEYGACINGRCEYACALGAIPCDGTCTYVGWDADNCGACGNACVGDTPFCYEGACIGCPPELVLCDNACIDVGWDPNNCGACGNVCGGSAPYCNQGECSPCWPGSALCDGTCTNLDSDPANCGACGNVCGESTPYCSAGTCGQIRCFGGQALCGGVCREISLDPSNCGGCGVVCGPGENCAGGLCQSTE
jgi:hypothetical protein